MENESLEDKVAQAARRWIRTESIINNPNLVLANSSASAVLLDVVRSELIEFADFSPKGWTYNGEGILYTSGDNIFVRDLSGTDQLVAIGRGNCLRLSQSPDGKAFLHLNIGDVLDTILHIDKIGGDVNRERAFDKSLSEEFNEHRVDRFVTRFCWSPTGRYFAYEKRKRTMEELSIVNAIEPAWKLLLDPVNHDFEGVIVRDTKTLEQVTRYEGSNPGWYSPDSKSECFLYVSGGELFMVNLDEPIHKKVHRFFRVTSYSQKTIYENVRCPTYASQDGFIAFESDYFLKVIDTNGEEVFSRAMSPDNVKTLWSPGSFKDGTLSLLGINEHTGDGFVHNLRTGESRSFAFNRSIYPIQWRPYGRNS